MLFIESVILAILFVILCNKPLKKYSDVFYILCTAISVSCIFFDLRCESAFINKYILGLFNQCSFATALWCLVMWGGALPNKSKGIKLIMPVRGELSIMAAILTLGHNLKYGKTYFTGLFSSAENMKPNYIAASIISLIMIIIMVPLTIMSFKKIRKKFRAGTWKKIQSAAYIFYALIYIHVLILNIPFALAGREGYFFNVIAYSVVFIGYAVCRIRKWYILRKHSESTSVINLVSCIAFAVPVAIVAIFSIPDSADNVIPVETTISETSAVISETETETSVMKTETTSEISETTSEASEITEISETTSETEKISESAEDEEYQEYDEENQNDKYNYEDNYEEENNQPDDNQQNDIIVDEPEIEYIYNNGSYTATAYGYDGDVEVTITIENDVIIDISAVTYESDSWYFDTAQGSVISQILDTQQCDVDAVSGATYSSNAIMSAVAEALNMARR